MKPRTCLKTELKTSEDEIIAPTLHCPSPFSTYTNSFQMDSMGHLKPGPLHDIVDEAGNQNIRNTFINDANSRLLNSRYNLLQSCSEDPSTSVTGAILARNKRSRKRNYNNINDKICGTDNLRSSSSSPTSPMIGKQFVKTITSKKFIFSIYLVSNHEE